MLYCEECNSWSFGELLWSEGYGYNLSPVGSVIRVSVPSFSLNVMLIREDFDALGNVSGSYEHKLSDYVTS